MVNFYSDFSQLKYVFAEVDQENANIKGKQKDIDLSNVTKNTSIKNTEKIKINILNEQIEILNESNSKLNEKNNILNNKKNQLNQEVVDLKLRVETQLNEIEQNNINQGELEFLRLNLIYSSKCQKTTFKKGYKVGTQEYKDCIFRKGKRVDD